MAGIIDSRTKTEGRAGSGLMGSLRAALKPRWTAAVLVALVALMGVVLPFDEAEATNHYFNSNNGCVAGTLTGYQSTTLSTAAPTCKQTVTLNVTGAGKKDVLLGYFSNSTGYAGRTLITGASTGSDIRFRGTQNDTLHLALVEVDPSTNTVVQDIGTELSYTIPASCATATCTWTPNLTTASGNIGKGYTFGYIVRHTGSNQVTLYYGDNTAGTYLIVNVAPANNYDTVDATNTAMQAAGNINQGDRDVPMQRIFLDKTLEVYGAADPKLDSVDIKGIGASVNTDVKKVKLWQSANTTLETDGTDTYLGYGTFDSSGNMTIDIASALEPTIDATGFYLIVSANIDINADDTHTVQTQVTANADIDINDDALTGTFPMSSNTLDIQGILKDTLTIGDEAVWSSGYLEQGVVNAPVMSYSLDVTGTGDDSAGAIYSIYVDEIGDIATTDITKVKAWWSTDNSFSATADTQMHTDTKQFDPTTRKVEIVENTASTFTVTDPTKSYIFITYDISATADTTKWVRAEMVNEQYVELVADLVNTYTGYQSNLIPIRVTNFKTVGECYECHTFPPTDVTQGTTVRNPYAGAVVGDHERISHVPDKTEASCAACHWPLPGGEMNHQDGIVQINTSIYDGGVNAQYSRPSFPHTNNPTQGTCANVTCHVDMTPQWGIDTIQCKDCHDAHLGNERRNIVGGTTGDLTNTSNKSNHIHNTTAFADSSCEVCHLRSTHTRENDPQVRLFNGDTGEAVLYDGNGASALPACVSCHDSDGVARLGQNALRPFYASGDETAPPDVGWKAGKSAHDVAANIAQQKCLACHGNFSAVANTTLNPKKNAHNSSVSNILQFSYDPAASQGFCYSCHNGTGSTKNVRASFGAVYNHAAQGKEHCMDCHAVHEAEHGLHTPGLGVAGLAPVLKGTKNPATGQQYEKDNDVCFRPGGSSCHNQATIYKSNTASETGADSAYATTGSEYATYWRTIPNITTQFATTNYAYHPLFKTGRNQPTSGLNSAWTGTVARASGEGLDHTFVDGWSASSLVTCTDCHDSLYVGGSLARGPHGASQPWILKGADTSVTVTLSASTITPNSLITTATTYAVRNFCINCHRSDVYGSGEANPNPANSALSRLGDHDPCTGADPGGKSGTPVRFGCYNCHAGAQVAGIHGTSLGVGSLGSAGDEMGKRFMNGALWGAHQLAGGTIGCSTGQPNATDSTSGSKNAITTFNAAGCSAHDGGWATIAPSYTYDWQ